MNLLSLVTRKVSLSFAQVGKAKKDSSPPACLDAESGRLNAHCINSFVFDKNYLNFD
jgi:hypothetical protein